MQLFGFTIRMLFSKYEQYEQKQLLEASYLNLALRPHTT